MVYGMLSNFTKRKDFQNAVFSIIKYFDFLNTF